MNSKIGVLIGTRPGIIKMSPLIHELKRRQAEYFVVHTGQHFSESMDKNIMADVGLGEPDYHITRPKDCVTHAEQTSYMLTAIEKILLKEGPNIFLVCGDANTNLSGALAARKIHVQVGHVEAGLRSFDWRMPEEHNRIIIDHISEYLFAPTRQARENLISDGVRGEVFVVGNTIVDATLEYSKTAIQKLQSRVDEVVNGELFILLTLHREENVDRENTLKGIFEAVLGILSRNDLIAVFPIHPRTWKRIKAFGMEQALLSRENLKVIEPLPYLDFLAFLSNARLVMTDSGGLQEESCILEVPCITLRESTERQETIEIGANSLAGTDKEKIEEIFESVINVKPGEKVWTNPYGDGKTSKRIIDTCLNGRPNNEWEGHDL